MERDDWKGGGISWLWGLREDHPFQVAFLWHDKAADKIGGITRRDDEVFYWMMKSIANQFKGAKRLWLLSQARLFYSLAVGWRLSVRRKSGLS